MGNYFKTYIKYIENRDTIPKFEMERGKFYMLKDYKYVDENDKLADDSLPPIIFCLFMDWKDDLVHAVKVSNVNPMLVKRFFKRLYDPKIADISVKGSPKRIYEDIIRKIPVITKNSYRTYRYSNIRKVFALELDERKLLPAKEVKDLINKRIITEKKGEKLTQTKDKKGKDKNKK